MIDLLLFQSMLNPDAIYSQHLVIAQQSSTLEIETSLPEDSSELQTSPPPPSSLSPQSSNTSQSEPQKISPQKSQNQTANHSSLMPNVPQTRPGHSLMIPSPPPNNKAKPGGRL